MDFISNKQPQIEEMIRFLGVSSIEDLFQAIPSSLRLSSPPTEDGLSEWEGLQWMEGLAAKNSFSSFENYLGAGAYEHHVPALVGALIQKSEFLTSYTPYQAEASQGMLQAIFEFQSAICALTGMDAANASVYDGASACAEALLMALRYHKTRRKVLVGGDLSPFYLKTIKQYLANLSVQIEVIPFLEKGELDKSYVKKALDEETAAVLLAYPNFFGSLSLTRDYGVWAKEKGALTVLCANPLVYGLFASAREWGADIAVGDCQPLGLPLNFGGPYAGYMACTQELIRQLPGRLVGETQDSQGRRGYVLTLQAREQHIRREKANSNICTNQALATLASLIALLWYGKQGLKELALTNYQRAAYLRNQLSEIPGAHTLDQGSLPVFNEFAVRFSAPIEKVFSSFRKEGIEPGVNLGRFFPALEGYLLVAVTETKSKRQLDRYAQVARQLVS